MNFPVVKFQNNIKSFNLDKTQSYKGILKGIKGQYLIFEDGTVFIVSNQEGYVVEIGLENLKATEFDYYSYHNNETGIVFLDGRFELFDL